MHREWACIHGFSSGVPGVLGLLRAGGTEREPHGDQRGPADRSSQGELPGGAASTWAERSARRWTSTGGGGCESERRQRGLPCLGTRSFSVLRAQQGYGHMRLPTDNGRGTSPRQSRGPRGSQPGLVGIPGLLLSGCAASGKAPSLCALACSSDGVVVGMEWAGGRDAARGSSCAGFTAEERGAQGEEWSVWGTRQGALVLPPAEPRSALPWDPWGRGRSADVSKPWARKRGWGWGGQRQPGLWGWEMSGSLPPRDPRKVTSEQLLHCGTPSAPKGKTTAPCRDQERHTHAQIHQHAHTLSSPPISNTSEWKLADAWLAPRNLLTPPHDSCLR